MFNCLAATVDGFADQIESVVTAALDDLAPLRRRRRRQPKRITRWLSHDAVEAKRRRRRLERRWLRTCDAYRRACRSANATINEAHVAATSVTSSTRRRTALNVGELSRHCCTPTRTILFYQTLKVILCAIAFLSSSLTKSPI